MEKNQIVHKCNITITKIYNDSVTRKGSHRWHDMFYNQNLKYIHIISGVCEEYIRGEIETDKLC